MKYEKFFICSGRKAENKSNEPSQYIDIGRNTPGEGSREHRVNSLASGAELDRARAG